MYFQTTFDTLYNENETNSKNDDPFISRPFYLEHYGFENG